MSSDLKPTSREERERWVREMDERDNLPWLHRDAVLRLIADHERLIAAVQKHRRDVWGAKRLIGHDSDVELYREVLGAK